jgi:N-acetylmuramoyl-L-alanine amidase
VREITKIILHCTGTDIPGQNAAMVTRWHKLRGWRTIGYHRLILADGSVEDGRPEQEIGAHCQGENLDSIGLCIVGGKTFGPALMASLHRVLEDYARRFPKATLHGHREFNPHKTCPNIPMTEEKELWKKRVTSPASTSAGSQGKTAT